MDFGSRERDKGRKFASGAEKRKIKEKKNKKSKSKKKLSL